MSQHVRVIVKAQTSHSSDSSCGEGEKHLGRDSRDSFLRR